MSYEEYGDREASRVAQCGEETCYSLYSCPLQESFNLSITSWQIDGETMETVTDFLFLGSKITAMVTAGMKLKDACSLEEKLWQT